ncbi:MAG: RNA-binding transcriptional accessory protein [Methylotenera sp.]|nr:RNA-binding transcriptional accessory protein [Oligoflexia bacterium]
MTFETWFKESHPTISLHSAAAVLSLSAEGSTLPFIARYRKEQTGNLDEVGIQNVIEAKENWDSILKRKDFILGEIEHQKKLTPELKDKISTTFNLSELEDLYLPYKQKRKTKATLAKEAGLEPLAEWIWNIGHGTEQPLEGQTLDLWAFTFKNEEKGFNDAAAAVGGAQDILIERLSETQALRQLVRTTTFEKGMVRTGKAPKAKQNSKYENYFTFHEPITSLVQPQNSHRYLALRRGWMEEELTLNIGGAPDDTSLEDFLLKSFENEACTVPGAVGSEVLLKSARLAFKAHVFPSIESEVHKALKDVADETAIRVFAENVRKLLLSSPFGPKAVLGVDPGIRTGCKVAVVNDSGKFVADTVMHLQTADQKEKAKLLLIEVVKHGDIRAIAVGNGTAGRETESYIRATLKEAEMNVPVVMVNESGASVYSASEAAREEFPQLDVTVRGAISIARRLQDPLAELVKIDPKSIGVGQYQHDVAPNALKRSLELVVDTCVNSVGVNLNTASYHLLSHVSGIGPALAKSIVKHRDEKGLFKNRTQLMEVSRFSSKAYEQAAGFLRIPDSEHPLDNTGVHPERYPLLENLAKKLGKDLKELMGAGVKLVKGAKELKDEVGQFTFEDIVRELEKPGRDPREGFVAFQYRDDIFEVKDLKPGMICPGIVTNVTNFGAFVDIGVHQDGLVHLSQLSNKFIKDPREVVSPGDRVTVKVLEVNFEKKQISLTMKTSGKAATADSDTNTRPERAPRASHDRAPHDRASRGQQHAKGPKLVPSGEPSPVKQAQPKPVMVPSGARSPVRPPKPQFANNPFAAGLANLKKDLKR